jgi:hypothetical protein
MKKEATRNKTKRNEVNSVKRCFEKMNGDSQEVQPALLFVIGKQL